MAEEYVTVSVRSGALKGRRQRTEDGQSFNSFEGVPYAKPPIGPLRFKAPEPLEPWTGVRDATKAGKMCIHYDGQLKEIVGDEDCLFLNVHTPQLPSESRTTSLPVMVYIHGGGFAFGCGHTYEPAPFMDKGVVVVTINFRLGPLGFLSLGTLDVPGNAGLKDQTMALRWIKENIAVFEGDPNNVTIFGESAGGAAVHFLLLSPLAKGLFHRVIAQSGSAFCPWAVIHDPIARAKSLALAAGCEPKTAEDPVALAKWLREAPALSLVTHIGACFTEEEIAKSMILPFVPCVEPDHPGAFMPKTPAALMASGNVPKVPVIIGITSHEGIVFLPGAVLKFDCFRVPPGGKKSTQEELEMAEAKAMAQLSSRPELLLPENLPGRSDPKKEAQLVQRLKDFFFDGKQPSEEKLSSLIDVYSDTQFVLGALRAAWELARHGSPVHVYEFAYKGRVNCYSLLLNCKEEHVCHGDELSYLFNMPGVPRPEQGSKDEITRQRLVRLWANFAKNGNPTSSLDDLIKVSWPRYSESAPNYLKIGEELEANTDLLKERMLFWRSLYGK
ncbi:Esterase FE4 [Gryllus bimaculatus]|nr:Esterase FE4 [Gryllus bimaculatus]